MKKIKKFLIIPLVALLFGLLPQTKVFADVNSEIDPLLLVPSYVTGERFKYFTDKSNSYNPNRDNSKYVNFYNSLPVKGDVVDFMMVDYYNKQVYHYYLTQADVESDDYYKFNSVPNDESYLNWTSIGYTLRADVYEFSTLAYSKTSNVSGSFPLDYDKFYMIKNFREYTSIVPEEDPSEHPTELPSVGNGILITSPASGSKINKLEYNAKGYLEQVFTLRVQYKPNDKSIFGVNDEQQKLDVIKGISCEMEDSDFDYHIFSDSFKWITKPSKAIDSVSTPYAIAEMKISTVFKDLGKKKFIVTSALKVADDSTDITRDIREYTDSIIIEFVSDENYGDGVVINPDGTTGSDGSNSDINLDGFPTAPGSNATIIDWVKYFGDVIIWLVTYPFKLLANCFTVLGGYITVMVKTLQSTSEQITGLFTFIPKDILNVTYGIISFTLLYSVTRGVLRLIRGN